MIEETISRLHNPDKEPDSERRFFLGATSAIGAIGVVATAVPFVESMLPSERALVAAGPVEIDISKLAPGQIMVSQWRSRPVWVLHRTKAQLDTLAKVVPLLADPYSEEPQQPPSMDLHLKEGWRSLKAEYLVLVGICTHLGCVPDYRPVPGSITPSWQGGFFCPCHGSHYDLSGRVMKNFPAPLNLPVPPYFYESDTLIKVGELANKGDQQWRPSTW
ncbi:MAG: ubiquinol-cytochrome c reductase iron-sulfur subunit [Candidimonas sp.]|nr:MAG: ubiquinol-cytochrome c reductase iron-sulfur subunit [Candidimonas sp.]